MNEAMLGDDIQRFIQQHAGADLTRLALKPNPFPEVPYPDILQQIAARARAKDKLPTWFAAANILYPSKISVEQTSSERTAAYKASLVSGRRLADLTGGFGVDSFYFSKRMPQVVHVERDERLSEIARHNFARLQADNIDCLSLDSSRWLETAGQLDWIYVDPSRRNDAKGKVFMLKDCLPQVPSLLDFYLDHAPSVLIKTAPLLDLSAGLSELHSVKAIHVVAVENEVKELLWHIEKGWTAAPMITTVNLSKHGDQHFVFPYDGEARPVFTAPKRFLYEPNAAIMKAAGYDALAAEKNLMKLAPHSHLYTSDRLMDFPGRRFEITAQLSYSKNDMQRLKGERMNVTTRNFPDTVETIRKKWKLADGGDVYAFFTTDAANAKIVLLCGQIRSAP